MNNTIKQFNFELIDTKQIHKHVNLQITKHNIYDETGGPSKDGPLDPRLGATKGRACETCGAEVGFCTGHEGLLKLAKPVLHPNLRTHFKKFIQSYCRSCKKYNPKNKACDCNGPKNKYNFITPYTVKDLNNNALLNIPELYEQLKLAPQTQIDKFIKNFNIQNLFISELIVPSINIRPSTIVNNNVMVDHLTSKIQTIVGLNKKLQNLVDSGYIGSTTDQTYNLLTYQIFTYMDNKISKLPVSTLRTGKPVKSLLERLESKEGLLRSNLRGKRTAFAVRAVISPDPDISVEQVGVSETLARSITKPIAVTKYNIDQVKAWIENDTGVKVTYYDYKLESGQFAKLKVVDDNRNIILENIEVGDLVHRTLINGDYVIVNRAPTIHRFNLMGHRIVVYKNSTGTTIKLNPSICEPYNADFDGDEVMMHVPQTVSATIDAQMYMSVKNNYKDPKNGLPIIGLDKEQITAAYVMSKNNPCFTRSQAIELTGRYFKNDPSRTSYTGRDLISMCLPSNFNFSNADLLVENGTFVSGVLTKSNFGRTSRFSEAIMTFASEQYGEIIAKLTRLFRSYYGTIGRSLSIADFKDCETVVQKIRTQYQTKAQHCSMDELDRLSKTYQVSAFEHIKSKLVELSHNQAVQMALAGSSGSIVNLVQMQSVLGPRFVRGMVPHEYFHHLYGKYDTLKDKLYRLGWIWGNYSTGLTFRQFINDSMQSRDSMLTNQLKVTQMGYFSRKLLCSLSDVYINKHNQVVDSSGRIIQTRFGGSGVNLEDYKTSTSNSNLKRLIQNLTFRQQSDTNLRYRLDQLEKFILDHGFDRSIYDIIKMNSSPDKTFTPQQCIRITNYLLTPGGTPIGVATGHAISEPTMQLTLDAKHKSSLGIDATVERLMSLIDRSLTDPTIVITCNNDESFNVCKSIIPVKLSQVAHIELNYTSKQMYVYTTSQVVDSLKNVLQKIGGYVMTVAQDHVRVKFNDDVSLKSFKDYVHLLRGTTLSGFSGLTRSVVNTQKKGVLLTGKKNTIQLYRYVHMLESKLRSLDPEVCIRYLDPVYLAQRKGIEAARKLLYNELVLFLKKGVLIDSRYLSLFCDLMSYTGEFVALSRNGIINQKSPLTQCAFEAVKKVVYNLAISKQKDNLNSPISSLIIGQNIKLGPYYYDVHL